MASRLKTVTLACVVAAAALAPLFGDPRHTPVTHPVWARLLLRGLDMSEAVRASTHASQVFAALSWRETLALPADRFAQADRVTVEQRAGVRVVAATDGTGHVAYPFAVVRGGDYQVRARLASTDGSPATAEILADGRATTLKTLTFAASRTLGWVPGGTAHLDPGSYTASLLLPQGTSVESVEVAPPCLNAIEPPGGWRASAITTVDDVAVTLLKAADLESELPPADVPIERAGGAFELESGPRLGPAAGFDGFALRAERGGTRAILTLDLAEPGLYTLSAFGTTGAGQRWLADHCRKAVLCPSQGAGWHVVMSQAFSAGRHTFAVALAEGAVVERVRLERKQDRAGDYLGTVRRLGFDPGAQGAVTREKALAAMRFVQERRRAGGGRGCGDVVVPETSAPLLAEAAAPAAAPGAAAPPPAAAPPAPSPIDTTLLPPQQPVSPVQPLAALEVARPGA